jgi:hypothetical protein
VLSPRKEHRGVNASAAPPVNWRSYIVEPPGVWEPLEPTENYYLTESELRLYDLRNRSLNATDHVDKIYPVYNTEAEAAAAAIYERDRRLKAAGAGLLERILTAIFHPGGFFDYGVLAGYGFSGGAVGRGWQTDPIPLAYEVNPGIYLEMPQPGPGQELYGPWPQPVGPQANPTAPRAGQPATAVAPTTGPKPSPNFVKPTNPPQHPPASIPFGTRIFRGKPTQQYPNGYWKIEKFDGQGWQRLDPRTMKPGPHPDTHIPFPDDYAGPFDN